ncbi:MAG: transcription-repair coupling factor [Ruminococcaceae bacterium]|nr:transcription-repair coupling factor [Oscillospiraceae bacterium]
MNFSDLLKEYQPYQALEKNLTPVSVAGIVESAQPQLIYELTKAKKTNALVVCYSDMEAKQLCDQLQFFNQDVCRFPAREYVFHRVDSFARHAEQERLSALAAFSKRKCITVTSLEAVLCYTLPRTFFDAESFSLKVGEQFSIESLCERLVRMGYVREDAVEGKGQFSLRGGIVDVFLPDEANPVRIEFFDDEIDSIRIFDPETQRSIEQTDMVSVIPCREAIVTPEAKLSLLEQIEEQIKSLKRKKGDWDVMIHTLSEDAEAIREQGAFSAIDKYAQMLYGELPTILDYCDSDTLIYLLEPKRLNERAKSLEWEQGELLDDLSERGLLLLGKMDFWFPYQEFVKRVEELPLYSLNGLNHSSIDYHYRSVCSFVTRTTLSLHGKVEYLLDDMKEYQNRKATVVILAANRSRAENLTGTLNDKKIPAKFSEIGEFKKGEITVMVGSIHKGFEYPELPFVLISDQEIFEIRKKRRAQDKANRIKSYTDLNIGDYVVHQAHGIGQYMGIHQMTVNQITKDYLKIQYQGTDTLYVPVDQMDMLYKYVGSDETKLKLNRLGGTDWSKTKAKVKSATKDMAKQLVALYAARERTKGYAFSEDTPWQRDFEDTFLYQETDDQLQSIEEVKKDMESERPMDRLLCGDVGYGKTEVALRAAFKAVMDSKQVAYLCPTTVLAMQQYNNFCQRMRDFPITVEMLSRFRSPSQQAKILKKLKSGEIDILIGTHRLLQKDVVFHDLGFLIIDEEQRFGVAAKERLKELKKDVDVLSMTATPIPRTLHMSMIHVRDMSLLETPPENRYPVQTYVLEHDQQILIDAMKKELARGGQVFYLYNRVQGIYRTAEWIKKMIPDARVAVGHGKMKEEELEDIMYDMVNGETDILVCTTIIETGLDIPNANTMIIENADRMGLSQLYQLRGRVGRSNRSAYAYFTYKRDMILSDVAQKRLRAIKEFTEFGSGFKIAMRDLEIRGAGNLLGAQQHGHMDSVGYDMYCKLLKESVDEETGVFSQAAFETVIDLSVDAYIPERYIKNQNQRIDVYKRIASIESEEDAVEVTDELIDRFGDLPRVVRALIAVAQIKALAHQCGITEIKEVGKTIRLTFAPEQLDARIVLKLSEKFVNQIKVVASDCPKINFLGTDHSLSNIKFLLQSIFELKN